MTDSYSGFQPVPLEITLIINQDEDEEFRDKQARQLLKFCQDWPSIKEAQLATEGAPEDSRVAEATIAGQILVSVAPTLVSDFINHFKSWIQMANPKPIKIKVGDREAEFHDNIDEAQLAAWFKAMEATPGGEKGKSEDEG